MDSHLIAIVVMALAGMGAFVAQDEGMVLHGLRKLSNGWPDFIRKPVSACSRCMVSVWGTLAVVLIGVPVNWPALPLYWLCAAGLQELIER